MSILFQALNKATQDRAQPVFPSASFGRGVAPSFPSFSLWRKATFFLLGSLALLTCGGVLAHWLSPLPFAQMQGSASIAQQETKAPDPDSATSLGIALAEVSQDALSDERGQKLPRIIGFDTTALQKERPAKRYVTVQEEEDLLPKDVQGKRALALRLGMLEQDDPREAMRAVEKITEQAPDFAPAWASYARLCMKDKDYRAARDYFEKAASLDPENKSYRLGLAIAYDQLGKGKEALAVYKTLAEPLDPVVRARRDYLAARYGQG